MAGSGNSRENIIQAVINELKESTRNPNIYVLLASGCYIERIAEGVSVDGTVTIYACEEVQSQLNRPFHPFSDLYAGKIHTQLRLALERGDRIILIPDGTVQGVAIGRYLAEDFHDKVKFVFLPGYFKKHLSTYRTSSKAQVDFRGILDNCGISDAVGITPRPILEGKTDEEITEAVKKIRSLGVGRLGLLDILKRTIMPAVAALIAAPFSAFGIQFGGAFVAPLVCSIVKPSDFSTLVNQSAETIGNSLNTLCIEVTKEPLKEAVKNIFDQLTKRGQPKDEFIGHMANLVKRISEVDDPVKDEVYAGIVDEVASGWGLTLTGFREFVANVQKLTVGHITTSRDVEMLKQELSGRFDGLRSQMIDIEANLGVFYESSGLGLARDHHGWILMRDIVGDRAVSLITSAGLENVERQIGERLDARKRVALIGFHGTGKSVLARYAVARRLERGDISKVILVQESNAESWGSAGGGTALLFDPVSPAIYAEGATPGLEFVRMEDKLRDIKETLRDLANVNSNACTLVVLPTSIWNQLEKNIRQYFEVADLGETTKDAGFLRSIVRAYSEPFDPPKGAVNKVLDLLGGLEGGHVLVAAYVGRWIRYQGGKIDSIDECFRVSQGRPKAILKEFVWYGILEKNEATARQFALPLLAHICLGDMSSELAACLPLSVPRAGLGQLDVKVARWISVRHEDLVEQVLIELGVEAFTHANRRTKPEDPFMRALTDVMAATIPVFRDDQEDYLNLLHTPDGSPLVFPQELRQGFDWVMTIHAAVYVLRKMSEEGLIQDPQYLHYLLELYSESRLLTGIGPRGTRTEEQGGIAGDYFCLDGKITTSGRSILRLLVPAIDFGSIEAECCQQLRLLVSRILAGQVSDIMVLHDGLPPVVCEAFSRARGACLDDALWMLRLVAHIAPPTVMSCEQVIDMLGRKGLQRIEESHVARAMASWTRTLVDLVPSKRRYVALAYLDPATGVLVEKLANNQLDDDFLLPLVDLLVAQAQAFNKNFEFNIGKMESYDAQLSRALALLQNRDKAFYYIARAETLRFLVNLLRKGGKEQAARDVVNAVFDEIENIRRSAQKQFIEYYGRRYLPPQKTDEDILAEGLNDLRAAMLFEKALIEFDLGDAGTREAVPAWLKEAKELYEKIGRHEDCLMCDFWGIKAEVLKQGPGYLATLQAFKQDAEKQFGQCPLDYIARFNAICMISEAVGKTLDDNLVKKYLARMILAPRIALPTVVLVQQLGYEVDYEEILHASLVRGTTGDEELDDSLLDPARYVLLGAEYSGMNVGTRILVDGFRNGNLRIALDAAAYEEPFANEILRQLPALHETALRDPESVLVVMSLIGMSYGKFLAFSYCRTKGLTSLALEVAHFHIDEPAMREPTWAPRLWSDIADHLDDKVKVDELLTTCLVCSL